DGEDQGWNRRPALSIDKNFGDRDRAAWSKCFEGLLEQQATAFLTFAVQNVPERRDHVAFTEVRGMQVTSHECVTVGETVPSSDFLRDCDDPGPIDRSDSYQGRLLRDGHAPH